MAQILAELLPGCRSEGLQHVRSRSVRLSGKPYTVSAAKPLRLMAHHTPVTV